MLKEFIVTGLGFIKIKKFVSILQDATCLRLLKTKIRENPKLLKPTT